MNIYNYENSLKQLVFVKIINLIFLIGEILFFSYIGLKNNLLSFTLIILLILIPWNLFLFLKSYIFSTKEIIITNNYNLKFIGYKVSNSISLYKKFEENLDLECCKYFLIKTTIKSANYSMQINYDNKFLYLDIGDEEVFKIYKILKEKYPENDLGQKWKFIIIGNTW